MNGDLMGFLVLMAMAILLAVTALLWTINAIRSESRAEVAAAQSLAAGSQASIYDISVTTIDGAETTLAPYRGKTLLIVNTASRCGFTPQYASLQKLYERYRDRGFEVLAFPANDFMGQEPGTNAEIKEFCSLKYRTTFPLFSKISVKGAGIHPLFRLLTTTPGHAGDIGWNFSKFLVAPDGRVAARWGSREDPLSPAVTDAIEASLTGSASAV